MARRGKPKSPENAPHERESGTQRTVGVVREMIARAERGDGVIRVRMDRAHRGADSVGRRVIFWWGDGRIEAVNEDHIVVAVVAAHARKRVG